MAKRKRDYKRTQPAKRNTNWLLIGGIGAGAILVVALLALAFREPDAASLADYCQENPDNCITKGEADAPANIIEVSDYNCIHCRNFNLETADLISDLIVAPGDAQYFVVPYALGAGTVAPAEGALCANDQERFFDYHRRMFQLQGTPGLFEPSGLAAVAGELGLDQETFESCLATGKYASAVQSNIRAAAQAGVNSTPTFYINDQRFRGNRPLTFFQEEISQILEGADAN